MRVIERALEQELPDQLNSDDVLVAEALVQKVVTGSTGAQRLMLLLRRGAKAYRVALALAGVLPAWYRGGWVPKVVRRTQRGRAETHLEVGFGDCDLRFAARSKHVCGEGMSFE